MSQDLHPSIISELRDSTASQNLMTLFLILTVDDHYIGAFTSMPFTAIICGCYRLINFYQFPWPSLRTPLAMMVLKTCLPLAVK